MLFTRITPSTRLQPIINYFWWIELGWRNLPDDFSERTLPDGSSEIVFHFGDKISRTSADDHIQSEPDSYLAGPNTTHYHITARGFVKMFGIKFYPHTVSFLLRENATQFKDHVLDLAAVWGNSINAIHERIAEAASLEARIALIENFLSGRLWDKQSLHMKYLEFAVRHVAENYGQVALPQIARKLGITPRYLEKLFAEHVGIGPKLLAEIIQLQNSVRLMNLHPTQSLADVAHASGYYDQSHYIRAVNRFTGLIPSRLKQEAMLMQQPFLDSIRD